MMYFGFYLSPKLEHIAFAPWWIVALAGLRNSDMYIFLGGIVTGIYLILSSTVQISAHLLIIFSMLLPKTKHLKGLSAVHFLCLFIYIGPSAYTFTYKEILAGVSCVLAHLMSSTLDIFSLSMIFSSPIALATCVLHGANIHWYTFYENNRFMKVRHSLHFIYPLTIILLAYMKYHL